MSLAIIYEILLALASFLAISGAIGLLRFPDFYTRVHANTISTVGGTILLCMALVIKNLSTSPLLSTKLFFLVLILFLTAPTASYMAGKAAYRSGQEPWRKNEVKK